MSKILIFAGTTEGRELSEWLCEKGCAHDLCVATEYGEQSMNDDPLVKVHAGRMDEAQIASFLERENIGVVVDATHPYAKEATENIKQAAEEGCQQAAVLLSQVYEQGAGPIAQDINQSLKNPLFCPLYNFICKHLNKPCESDFAGLF